MNTYTLFYFSDGDASLNLGAATDEQKFRIYIRNTVLLAISLGPKYTLSVLTNDAERYYRVLGVDGLSNANIRVIQVHFKLNVPSGIPFYSAHFKIAALEYLASSEMVDYPCLMLDSDMVFLSDRASNADGRSSCSGIGVYEITDQVKPAYGQEVIDEDLYELMGMETVDLALHWYGGEYLFLGTRQDAARLVQVIFEIWPRYCSSWQRLHHQGDEMVVSAALNILRWRGWRIRDDARMVRRHWSGSILHEQPSVLSLLRFRGFLHLPQDKKFLSLFLYFLWFTRFHRGTFLFAFLGVSCMKNTALWVRNLLQSA